MKIYRYIAWMAVLGGIVTAGHAQAQINKSSNSLQSVIGKTCSLSLQIQNQIVRPQQTQTTSTTTVNTVTTTTANTATVVVPVALNIVTLTGVPQASPQNSAQPSAKVSVLPLTIQPNTQVQLLALPINSLNTPTVTLNFNYALANNPNINYTVTLFTQSGNPCVITSAQQFSNLANPGAIITVNPNNTLVFN